jgi:hypothetical protein
MSRSGAALITVAVGVVAVVVFALTVGQFWVAAIGVVAFVVISWVTGARVAFGGALVWALFGLWEALIQFRITCEAECNIRVDIFLTFPIVIAASVVAAWLSLRQIGSG